MTNQAKEPATDNIETPTGAQADRNQRFAQAFTKRAVIYLRVSTAKQVRKDDDPDGYSLPAQRDSCLRKAEALDAKVAQIFIDRGESAKTADRPEFQRMLRFVKEQGDIDYVILDKVDRFARNRRDDANILFELRSVGCQLVSVKENIDETPGGQLLHAVMAGIAEFYSKNLATEAIKGMTQKAISGGTPGRAPIGYLNTRRRIDGAEIRVVEKDPERAPLVRWAFEQYATGEWTVAGLTEALADRGLDTLPRRNALPKPLALSRVANMLRNRYYIGKVTFKDVEYEGRHERLVSDELFSQVQLILDLHRNGEKQRVHTHYLKGSVFCAHCGSRLCVQQAKDYVYFFCLGRHQKRTNCTAPYLQVEAVEEAVTRYYQTVAGLLPASAHEDVRQRLRDELSDKARHLEPELKRARARMAELEEERRRLARGVITGAIPEDLGREEQQRITSEWEGAQRVLAVAELGYGQIEETLELALELVSRVDEVYRLGSDRVKRLLNQCFFEKLLVSLDDGEATVAGSMFAEPWGTLITGELAGQVDDDDHTKNLGPYLLGRGSKEMSMVPPVGFEPTHPPPERRIPRIISAGQDAVRMQRFGRGQMADKRSRD